MTTTRGDLVPAKIYEVDKAGVAALGQPITCMFNPFEYTVSKSNSYTQAKNSMGGGTQMELDNVSPQTLKLKLIFDTYDTMADVSLITQRLWELMEPKKNNNKDIKGTASYVVFEWGVFRFVSVITNMTQTFTLFTPIGTPIRAKVDMTFTQYMDRNDYLLRLPQNPTSGGGPIEQVWTVEAGQRLDHIATAVYDDASKWPLIASYNQISNPFRLRPGQKLTIPLETAEL